MYIHVEKKKDIYEMEFKHNGTECFMRDHSLKNIVDMLEIHFKHLKSTYSDYNTLRVESYTFE